jgi:HlyD family secretion protein
VAELLSSDAVNVKPGAIVWVGGFGGSNEVKGRVRRVEPSGFTKLSALGVEEQRVNVVSDFESVPEGMGDGYRVEVRAVVWDAPDVIMTPGSALFRAGAGWRVYVVENGRAVVKDVTLGHRTATHAEVLGGLRELERVILYPGDRVREGGRVQ